MGAVHSARAWLAKPGALLFIGAASVALNAVAVPTGLVLDDHFHAVALGDGPAALGAKRAPWDAFSFAKDPASIREMIDEGIFPWWSDLDARYAFLRPLTSLTLSVDYRAWPHTPALAHIHSLLWYALLLFMVARVYRRWPVAPGFVGLAFAVYALDDARSMTVGWIASRGALLALACGCGVLLAHDRFRTSGQKRWLAAALASLAVGLLCAEAAMQILGYVLAHALFLDRGSPWTRLRALIPYALLVGVWRVAYLALGYGALHTENYIDPGSDPLRFLAATATRLPILMTAQFGGLPSDVGDMVKYVAPDLAPLIVPICIVSTGIVIWLFARLLRDRVEARFWAVGTLLSTLPVMGLTPVDRVLATTALGGSALVAMLLLAVVDHAPGYRRRPIVAWVVFVGAVHLVIAPLLLPIRAYSLVHFDRYIAQADTSLPDDPGLANRTLVILNPPTDEYGIYVPFRRKARGATMPARIRWLATGDSALQVTRVDAVSLRVRPLEGFLGPHAMWTLRDHEKRSTIGDTLELTGVTYEVTDVTPDGRPAEVLARFDPPLDSKHFLWLQWDREHGGYTRFPLPDPGQTVRVPAVDLARILDTLEPPEG